jgi:hypothetical protein
LVLVAMVLLHLVLVAVVLLHLVLVAMVLLHMVLVDMVVVSAVMAVDSEEFKVFLSGLVSQHPINSIKTTYISKMTFSIIFPPQ